MNIQITGLLALYVFPTLNANLVCLGEPKQLGVDALNLTGPVLLVDAEGVRNVVLIQFPEIGFAWVNVSDITMDLADMRAYAARRGQ